jgi:mannose-6-phosphate isomerase-like protein (cupin superfamily)
MLVMNELEPEMDTAPHVHEGFDQIALIISGRGICHIGGVGHNVGPGSVMLIPAGVEHYLQPAGDEMITNLDVFAPARADFAHLVTWMQDAPVTTGQS